MPSQFTIALSRGVNAFYDEKTRTHLTRAASHKRLSFPDGANLQGIARGLFTMVPAIKLLEGTFPEAEKEKFLDGYKNKWAVVDRTTRLVNVPPIVEAAEPETVAKVDGQSLGEETLITSLDEEQEVTTQSVDEATLLTALDQEPAEEPVASKPTSRPRAAKTKA